MKCWNYYKLSRVIRERTHNEHKSLESIYILLALCILSLFSFLSLLFDYRVAFLLHIFIFYLIIAYNFPLVVKEYKLKRFQTYRTNRNVNFQLISYLIIENNPILPASIYYFLINTLLNTFNPYKCFLVLYSLLLVVVLLLTKLIPRKSFRILTVGSVYGLVILTFFNIEWLLFSLPYTAIVLYITSKKLVFLKDHRINSSSMTGGVNLSNHTISLKTAVWNVLIKKYYKILFGIFLSAIVGLIFQKTLRINVTGLLVFFGLLELELSIDAKYKYLYKYISKYYFLKNSPLNFWQRYLISQNYFSIVELSFYLIGLGIASRSSIYMILAYILLLFILGIIYFAIEEMMFRKQKKMNHLLFQYCIFVGLSLLMYYISFL